ncbi:hypothetical protein As57867_006795, partial [Aphanomyces stellatus]
MHARVLPNVGDIPLTAVPKDASRSEGPWQLAGFAYLCVSLGLNIYYISFLASSVTNNYYWAGFNSTGTETFLGDLFNSKLPLTYAIPSPLGLNRSLATFKSYAGANTFIDGSPSAARAAMISIPLEQAVVALRKTSFDTNIALSPYCWVDLKRTFGLAISAARQHRCEQHDMDNAAVYFEIPVRNSDGLMLTASINATIFGPLESIPAGQQWVASIASLVGLSAQDEVQVWRHAGLARWTFQMHNAWQNGMKQTIQIVNALGLTYQVGIHTVPYIHQSYNSWTTVNAWIGLPNMLYTCAALGCSLVRGMPNSIDQMPFDWGSDIVTGPTSSPVATLVTQYVGPYGLLDIRFVAPPRQLLDVILVFQVQYLAALALDPSTQRVFVQGSEPAVDPIPPSWIGV